MLIASSGDAETDAVTAAAAAWAAESGNSVEVRVATDMNQELAQGFASGNPPDIFYLDASRVGVNAQSGNLFAYTPAENDDFYQALRDTFTVDGTQYCAPKDFSTLALQINVASWEAAGLTDADIPTTYDELADGCSPADDRRAGRPRTRHRHRPLRRLRRRATAAGG